MLNRSIFLLFVCFFPLLVSAEVYTTSFRIKDPNASSEAVKIAIYESLTRRGWTVDEQNNLQTIAHLHKRKTKAKVVIDYSSTHVDIDTTGTRIYSTLGMSVSGPMVETEKTFNPRGWITNIVNDTKRLLPNAINQVKDQETSQESLTAQLSELKQLFEQGLISEEIYLEKQRNILQ